MPTMSVRIPETLASFVECQVADDGYASQSEVIRDALRLLHGSMEPARHFAPEPELATGAIVEGDQPPDRL